MLFTEQNKPYRGVRTKNVRLIYNVRVCASASAHARVMIRMFLFI